MSIRTPGLWLTLAALGAVPTGAVFAADMPLKAAPIAPVFYDWSGVYIGLHAGYGGAMNDWTADALGADFTAKGFLGGGQIGINKQIGSLVFGLELDGSWANIGGSQSFSLNGPLFGVQTDYNTRSKIDGLVTFTGRAGLAADRWFVYAKGGLAVAHETHSFSSNTFDLPPTPFSTVVSVSGSEYRWAPTVGFGTEYALGNNWSVKAEYNYIRLGSRAVGVDGSETFAGVVTPVAEQVQIEQALHVAKAGVNYRFGGIQTGPTLAPARAVPGYNWSGAYVGVQGGYGFGHQEWPDSFVPANPEIGKYDANGWLAGGTVGVNAQAGAFVFGVEGEWMRTGIKGSQTSFIDLGAGRTRTLGLESKVNWLAIAAARAGFVVGDRLLVYGKAGVALADERHTFTRNTSGPTGSFVFDLSAKALHTGVVAGAGAEYALGGNWSAKLEYDYIKMLAQNFTATGTQNINSPVNAGSIADFGQFGMPQHLHLIKFGINYHFNPAPVVVSARY
jgi:outer membrane immunogenic protein